MNLFLRAILLWLVGFVLLKFAEWQTRGRVSRWLQTRNVALYLGYVSWTTTRFNQTLMSTSQRNRKVLGVWFSIGVTIGLIGLVGSVLLLVGNLAAVLSFALKESHRPAAAEQIIFGTLPRIDSAYNSTVAVVHRRILNVASAENLTPLDHRWNSFQTTEENFILEMQAAADVAAHAAHAYGEALKVRTGFITPLLPGVNLPKSQIWYVVIAIFVSAVCHELGHALAAGTEELRVNGVSGFLALVFPGAYVQIKGVEQLTPWRQLKVYCAGPWHNIAVALCCVIGVLGLPAFMFPFFSVAANGALVVQVPTGSSLAGHVLPGDLVVAAGDHRISTRDAFFRGLGSAKVANRSLGFCIPEDLALGQAMAPGPGIQCFNEQSSNKTTCLPANAVGLASICHVREDCGLNSTNPLGCFVAIVGEEERLIDVHILGAESGKERHFLFQGQPEVLGHSIILSDYTPRFMSVTRHPSILAIYRWLVSLDLPRKFDRLLKYTFSVSVALALLNMAPVQCLDGEASAILFVRLIMPDMSLETQAHVKRIMLVIGTGLLLTNITLSLTLMES